MPYQRHDENCTPTGEGLLDINAYVRHDEDCVADTTQPTSSTATDSDGNQFKNWNADYVRHDETNTPG